MPALRPVFMSISMPRGYPRLVSLARATQAGWPVPRDTRRSRSLSSIVSGYA
jgi:hypothetical protein